MKHVRLVLLFVAATSARAHDFWIEPSTFRTDPGAPFTAALRVGEPFAGEAVPRNSEAIEAFTIRDASGDRSVPGLEGRDPAGIVRVDRDGTVVLGYRSKANAHVTTTEKFEQFLREEGLPPVRVSGAMQREHFTRYAKSIVQIGADANDVAPFGYPYELVLDGNSVRVLYERKPLANAFVAATSRDGRRMTARSDRHGRVSFALDAGEWIVTSVHLVHAPKGADYDWDSLWASLSVSRP